MYLKEIQTYGFKSFADKINFEFTNKSKLFSIVSKFNILESSNPHISFSIEACGSIKTILYFSSCLSLHRSKVQLTGQ